MGLFEFRDNVFLEHKGWWFLWEPAWESFRPVDGVQWDGSTFSINDQAYCSDPTDPLYGYGSAQMKQLCDLLKDKRDAEPVPTAVLPIGNLEWFRDRRVALTPCAPRDPKSWKRMVQKKPRTCRKAPRGNKFTKRVKKNYK